MNDIDHYLRSEYRDPDYQKYQLLRTPQPRFRWTFWLRRRPVALLPSGDTSLEKSAGVWHVGRDAPNLLCLEGALWLTKTGDPRDYVLRAGQSRRLEPGQWVVEALSPARFRVYRGVCEEAYCDEADLLLAL